MKRAPAGSGDVRKPPGAVGIQFRQEGPSEAVAGRVSTDGRQALCRRKETPNEQDVKTMLEKRFPVEAPANFAGAFASHVSPDGRQTLRRTDWTINTAANAIDGEGPSRQVDDRYASQLV